MANKYHPDKVSHLGKEMQDLAEEKFKAVNDAYQQIKETKNLMKKKSQVSSHISEVFTGMYKERTWTMRQYAGFTSSDESNQRFLKLLENGVMGLSIAFDLPTQIGYDSDHHMADGEVGKVGVPISILDDMERLFKDIPLGDVSTSMTINATAPILLAFYIVAAEKGST